MVVREGPNALQADVRGQTYYFCADSCRVEFTMPEEEAKVLRTHTSWAFLTGITILVSMWVLPVSQAALNWVFLALAAPVQFIAGARFYRGFVHSIHARSANMDTLIATGTTVAFAYSVLLTFLPERFGTATFYDTSVLIIAFILLGKAIEHTMKGRATDAVRRLLDLQPKTATVLVDGQEQTRPVEQLQRGDRLLVRPGQAVPTDCKVLEGTADVDESMLTGESMPVARGPGEAVLGGTINTNGRLVVEVRNVGADTALARIISLVEGAQAGQAPVQRIADRVASVFVPTVIAVAVAVFIGWWTLSPMGFTHAMLSGVAILIVACPCAIGLATPAALLVGTGKGAQNGILLKSGADLEHAHSTDTVLFDKTGTLTTGQLAVHAVHPAGGFDAATLLRLGAAAEAGSEHPIGRAVVEHAKARNIAPVDATAFEAHPGRGVSVRVDARDVRAGTAAWLADLKIGVGELETQAAQARAAGRSVVYVAQDTRLVGAIEIADEIKPGAREAVDALHARGRQVHLVTGDHEATANAVAQELGIDRVHAQVLPDQKEALVRSIQAQGRRVAMVGDGINDAPALAAADVGIAIGSGTDVAVEAAGIILINDDPRDVATALDLSRATLRKVKQNLGWAFGYNLALIPVAAAGLLDPVYAAAAMGLSSVSVVTNSLTLQRYKPPNWTEPRHSRREASDAPQAASEPSGLTVGVDPVCGMKADPETSEHTSVYQGMTIGFCRAACKEAFDADPELYASGSAGAQSPINTTLQL